ncbi:MAG: hypothetical protein AVDCRST_MAG66-185, partial [uncultured Pseudonocardia sp.]
GAAHRVPHPVLRRPRAADPLPGRAGPVARPVGLARARAGRHPARRQRGLLQRRAPRLHRPRAGRRRGDGPAGARPGRPAPALDGARPRPVARRPGRAGVRAAHGARVHGAGGRARRRERHRRHHDQPAGPPRGRRLGRRGRDRRPARPARRAGPGL